jgi:hypothetical protein
VKARIGAPQTATAWYLMIGNDCYFPAVYVNKFVVYVTGEILAVFSIHHESILVTWPLVISTTEYVSVVKVRSERG